MTVAVKHSKTPVIRSRSRAEATVVRCAFAGRLGRDPLSLASDITGGPVLDAYQFLQFHMHWGSHDLEGCEHVIDGERLPAEVAILSFDL